MAQPALTTALTSPLFLAQKQQPDMSIIQYLDAHPIAAVGIWVAAMFIILVLGAFLMRVAGIKLPWRRVRAGPVEVEFSGAAPTAAPAVCEDEIEARLAAEKVKHEAEKAELRDMLKRMMKEAFVYVHDLMENEQAELDRVKEDAREYTRQHVADFIAQITEMNHRIYQVKTGHPIPMGGDWHFNTICDGKVQVVLPRLLLGIFDRNHMREMSADVYRKTMLANYDYVKRQVFTLLAKDWRHPDYTFEDFMKGLEHNDDRGIDGFMWLMDKYRDLSDERKAIKLRTQEQVVSAVDHIEDHGEIPMKDF
jgi:hypothetical protein